MMSLKHHKKLLRLCVALACVNAMLGDIPGLQVAKACPWIKSTRNVRAPASQYQSGHKAWPIFALVWSLGEDHADFHCLVRLDACAEITDATTGMEIEAQLELLRQDVGSVFAELPWPAAACRGLLLSSAALVCLACSPSCLGLLLPAAALVCLACSPFNCKRQPSMQPPRERHSKPRLDLSLKNSRGSHATSRHDEKKKRFSRQSHRT